MKIARRLCNWAIVALSFIHFCNSSEARPLRYPDNLAWRLITETEIKNITRCPEMPGNEKKHALPLFSQPIAPLNAINVIPNGQLPLEPAATSWEVAPFPFIAPPKSDSGWQPAIAGAVIKGTSPKAPIPESAPKVEQQPAVFSEVLAKERPSAALRPRPRTAGEQLLSPANRLPEPFTLRRYSTDKHGFFQICLYGGYSSINAEIAYKTLRTASPNRQALSGLGKEAFLSLVELPNDPNSPEEIQRNDKLAPESFEDKDDISMGFSDIAPEGSQRFDLTDPAFIKAQQAPFFNDIPIDATNLTAVLPDNLPEALKETSAPIEQILSGEEKPKEAFPSAKIDSELPSVSPSPSVQPPAPVAPAPAPLAAPIPQSLDGDLSDAEKNEISPAPDSSQEQMYASTTSMEKDSEETSDPFSKRPNFTEKSGNKVLVLIAHYPDKDTVVELAMDTRMGNLQNLIAIAYLVQYRLINRW